MRELLPMNRSSLTKRMTQTGSVPRTCAQIVNGCVPQPALLCVLRGAEKSAKRIPTFDEIFVI
jgi:hypothetical protein